MRLNIPFIQLEDKRRNSYDKYINKSIKEIFITACI